LGQDGAYLSKLLLDKGYKVHGVIRRHAVPVYSNTDYLGVTDKIDFIGGDVSDECSMMNLIKQTQPDEVYNLAAQSFVGSSWDQPKITTEINALGPLYILSAIKAFSPTTKFYQASTSEMYGKSHNNGLQTDDTPFHPRSPYAISKLYAYWITNNYKESYGMYCCNGILFNHESPIRGKEFVTRKITDGIARIKAGLSKDIKLGNLDSRRDWGFAGDFVEAMWLMMQQKEPDNYLISTGETHSIREFLDTAFEYAGMGKWDKYVKTDPMFKRPADVELLKGQSEKAFKAFGWKPKVTFKKLVEMMVDADLKRYGVSK